MTGLFQYIFGRMPVGWLQLSHNRARLIAAIFGVVFANLLVLVQLGVVAAMNNVVSLSYSPIRADIIISPASANSFFAGVHVPRRLLYLALSDPAVLAGTPLYLEGLEWKRSNGTTTELVVYGLPRDAARFKGSIAPQLPALGLPGHILIDDALTSSEGVSFENASSVEPQIFEINAKTVSVVGTLRLGGGFGFDGGAAMSDQTFFDLVGASASTPSQILLDVQPGEDAALIAARLDARLAHEHVKVRTTAQAIADDIAYMNTQVPMGIIFVIGVVMSVIVGVVIVYQVLSTDVAAHIREYATFKAIGYPQHFFLGVVFEEALIMAIFGSLPGVAIGSLIYAAMASATGLPLGMTVGRAALLLLGTIAACTISGALATRRLSAADPAELFA